MDASLPKPPTNDQPAPQAAEKPKKDKKPPTEAQQAARETGLQAMMAKRNELAVKQKEKKEEVKKAKKVVEEKILKEDLRFASLNDIDELKNHFIKEIGELRGMLTAKQQFEKEKAAEKPAPKAERIVERVIERVPTPSAQPTKLTGTALLDRLFI